MSNVAEVIRRRWRRFPSSRHVRYDTAVRWSLEIYGLSACFVSLLCFVVSFGIGLYDLVQVAGPAFTLNAHEHERHQSNDRFRSPMSAFTMMPSDLGGALGPDITRMPGSVAGRLSAMPSEVEITRQREDSYGDYI